LWKVKKKASQETKEKATHHNDVTGKKKVKEKNGQDP